MIKPKAPKPEETEYLGEELEEEDEEEEDPKLILDQIRETEVFMEGGINKIPDTYIAGLLKTYLAKNFCQNRGYVLDDFPQITAQVHDCLYHHPLLHCGCCRPKNYSAKPKSQQVKKKKWWK
mgnify:FL=1